jgi:hypothetical protein
MPDATGAQRDPRTKRGKTMFGVSSSERAQKHADTAEGYANMVAHDPDLSPAERRAGSQMGAAAARRAERLDPGITDRRRALRVIDEITGRR